MAYFKITKPRSTHVTLTRTAHPMTPEVALWVAIRHSCSHLDFRHYKFFIDDVMSVGSLRQRDLHGPDVDHPHRDHEVIEDYRRVVGPDPLRVEGDSPKFSLLPFTGSDRYALLKAATEVFVMAKCGVNLRVEDFARIVAEVSHDVEVIGNGIDFAKITPHLWSRYLDHISLPGRTILPYHGLILDKLKDARIDTLPRQRELTSAAYRVLREKLVHPCLLELIWSYWHEEGMLVQTMNAILLRFQNVRIADFDPLANMEIDPLRPLNNLLWGLIQDEQNRLSVQRRAYEYNHQYGISLVGKAIMLGVRGSGSRTLAISSPAPRSASAMSRRGCAPTQLVKQARTDNRSLIAAPSFTPSPPDRIVSAVETDQVDYGCYLWVTVICKQGVDVRE